MKRLLGLPLFGSALLAASTMPTIVRAQMQAYYHTGAWDAFSGRDEKGTAVCGIGYTSPANEHRISMRFNIGGASTTFMVSKPDWSIPAASRIAVVMQIGLNAPWTEQAAGDADSMSWVLDQSAMQVFNSQFQAASSMTVTFPDGNEPPWIVPLDGSSAISGTFSRCITDLTRQVQAATSPVDTTTPPPGPTQPFNPSTPTH